MKIINPHNNKTYILEEKIGEGGYGTVFIGYNNVNINEKIAIKRIKIMNQDMKEFIKNELKISMDLMNKCKNTVNIYDNFFIENENTHYIIMELIKGYDLFSLYDVIDDYSTEKKDEYITILFKKSISELLCMHKTGIIHRDIKSENIMFVNNTPPLIKFIDFGLSCYIDKCVGEQGTFKFMAPEIVLNNYPTSYLSDIYSMGITFLDIYDNDFAEGVELTDSVIKNYYENYNKLYESYIKNKFLTIGIPKELLIIKDMIHPNPLYRPNTQELFDILNGNDPLSIYERININTNMLKMI